ncbi:MAG: hypothetical protein MUF65_06535 [Rubritepida sp.]|jgi:hypothetical protein|nr:hypothetical protein [Rubritepida sp.]
MAGPGTASARYEPRHHRLRLVFTGDVDSAAYMACMEGWLHAEPAAASADWLYDLRDYHGSVSHDDVQAFARAYDAVVGTSDAGAISVFVTPDPGFRFWVQACAHAFARRRLIVVNTLPEAEALLHGDAAPAA